MVNYVAASDLAVAEPPEFAIDSLSFRAASSLCILSIYKNITGLKLLFISLEVILYIIQSNYVYFDTNNFC